MTPRTTHLPFPGKQSIVIPSSRGHRSTVAAEVLSLAINGHRRSDDQLFQLLFRIHDDIEQVGRSYRVDLHVPLNLIHGLADADRRCLVEDDINTCQGPLESSTVSDIPMDKLYFAAEIPRNSLLLSMDLGVQAIKDPHRVTLCEKSIRQVRANEAGAAGY